MSEDNTPVSDGDAGPSTSSGNNSDEPVDDMKSHTANEVGIIDEDC